jgi:ribosome-binding protein aMBF1 (putative translation factor)
VTAQLPDPIAGIMLPEVYLISTYPELCAALRTAREERGLDQATLGDELGRVRSLISLRETGKRIIPGDELLTTLTHLGWKLAVIPPEDER